MENQTVYPPATPTPQVSGSSGANTVLLVIIILIIAVACFLLYKYYQTPAAPVGNNITNVTLPNTGGGEFTPVPAPATPSLY